MELFKECGEITDIRWVEKDGDFKGCAASFMPALACCDPALITSRGG
jgi:hypothetical protein